MCTEVRKQIYCATYMSPAATLLIDPMTTKEGLLNPETRINTVFIHGKTVNVLTEAK